MSCKRAFRSVLASVIALVVFKAIPAYASHGTGNVTSLVVDPLSPATLYAGTTDGGVFKSTNAGATWSPTGLIDTSVSALAIDPSVSSTLYALTPSGVLKSANAGASWIATGLMNEQISGFIYGFPNPAVGTVGSLAIAPRVDPGLPAALHAGVTYVTSDAFNEYVWGEVLRSTDGGSSWAAISPSGDPWAFAALGSAPALAIAPQTPTTPATVYASCTYEWDVCWLRDEGATIGGARLGHTFVGASSLVVDLQTPDTIYAGTNGLGVYKSTDGGATWSGGGTGAVRTLVVDPLTPAIVYAGTDDQGVLKSMDGAATWSAINSGLTSYIEALRLHPGIPVLAVDPLIPTTVYAGTAAGIFKSTDGGGNWSPTGLIQHSPLVSLSMNPAAVTGGTASTGTVSLNVAAPAGGTVITLSTTNPAVVAVPASVTVPAGATSANFAVSTSTVTASITLTISATLDGLAKSAALTVAPALAYAVLNPNGLAGGLASTGTVGLGLPAPAGGAVVSLSSSNPAVATVPATVTVAAGATTANFAISTSAVTAATTLTITAAYGGDNRSTVLNVVPTTLSSLKLNPASVPAGSASTGTVTLSVPAPAGGAVVTLSSSNTTVATVPVSVTVAAGATSANFAVSTSSVLPPTYSSIAVTIRASNGGANDYVALLVTLPPAAALSSLSLDATSLNGGSTSTGTVILSAAAPAGGAAVALSSSNPAVATIPASVSVPAGGTSANFPVSAVACTNGSATLSASYGGTTRSAGLTVTSIADSVTIQRADYFGSKDELRVAASSTGSSATLRVYVTSSGQLMGTMQSLGDGRYSGQFTSPVNPQSITLRSSLCGSATTVVRIRG